MGIKIKPSAQVKAAHDMGRIEARVLIDDPTLKAVDFTEYLINCESANILADNKVLKYITDQNLIASNRTLRKVYNKYKAKYWKA